MYGGAGGEKNSRPRGAISTVNLGVISAVLVYSGRMATRLDEVKLLLRYLKRGSEL